MHQDSAPSYPDTQWRKLPAWFTQLVDRHIARLENQASVPQQDKEGFPYPETAAVTKGEKL